MPTKIFFFLSMTPSSGKTRSNQINEGRFKQSRGWTNFVLFSVFGRSSRKIVSDIPHQRCQILFCLLVIWSNWRWIKWWNWMHKLEDKECMFAEGLHLIERLQDCAGLIRIDCLLRKTIFWNNGFGVLTVYQVNTQTASHIF